MTSPGTLYVVSTPIGNRADLSPRAIEVLGRVALVVAEDTRHTAPLLQWAGVSTPLRSHHQHNEARETPRLVERLVGGDDIAVVSDAGTPCLSDPGERLVAAAVTAGVPVVPVPGASALLAALVGSGLPAVPFTFVGFLPRPTGERRTALAAALALPHTVVCYEAPTRVADLLCAMVEHGAGERHAVVARELTKVHEEFRRGTVAELAAYYGGAPPRGEVVLVLAGAPAASVDQAGAAAVARRLRSEGATVRDTVTQLQAEFGVSRNEAYRLAQDA
ncbi:MAG: 16S rRNA (cytidine(1402)-2'-O)-methyltransferase [Gemmatimonadaceae bacterium]|nr:16S rRNA (cytidine(1402)-2'-O)-methyltransferase [Gemmatimonadaceae bacterium]